MPLLGGLAFCLIYPTYQTSRQMLMRGFNFFREFSNYVDIIQIGFGFLSIFQQTYADLWDNSPKIIMIVTVVTSLIK